MSSTNEFDMKTVINLSKYEAINNLSHSAKDIGNYVGRLFQSNPVNTVSLIGHWFIIIKCY